MIVALVSYGAGNLPSVARAIAHLGAHPRITASPIGLADAAAIVIPGVGHFSATAPLNDGWRRVIRDRIEAGTPLLGICLGMQWLFEGSDEAPALTGLGWFLGRCRRLMGPEKVPHVGWNTLAPTGRPSSWLGETHHDASVYFSHTFAAPVTPDTTSTCDHAGTFAATAERDRVIGVQFHPEKSGRVGLLQLDRFLSLARKDD